LEPFLTIVLELFETLLALNSVQNAFPVGNNRSDFCGLNWRLWVFAMDAPIAVGVILKHLFERFAQRMLGLEFFSDSHPEPVN
jgi:hypothetical protein